MYCLSHNEKKKRVSIFYIPTVFLVFLSKFLFAQQIPEQVTYSKSNGRVTSRSVSEGLEEKYLSIELNGYVLPKANVTTLEGNYHLTSNLNATVGFGIRYINSLPDRWAFITGLHFMLTSINFYSIISNSELAGTGIVRVSGAPPLISFKSVYSRIAIPFFISKHFSIPNKNEWEMRAGINLNYSISSGDEIITMSVSDTNNHQIPVFDASLNSSNNQKPWISFAAEVNKVFVFKNKKRMSVGLTAEICKARYITGNYEITIPNKPITRGIYAVRSSGLGLTVQYDFIHFHRVH